MYVSLVERLNGIQDLPSIPNTLNKVLSELAKESSTPDTIETIIKEDPLLTAKLLQVANSPYYGMAGKISSIARAIVIMGFAEVRNLVVGVSLTTMVTGDLGFEEFKTKDLWLHSVAVATAANKLAQHIPGMDTEEVFTLGIMHDIGRFLQCLYFPNEMRELLKANNGIKNLYPAEEKAGIPHTEIGAYLAHRWKLSELFVEAIRYHHRPQGAGPYTAHASVLFLADQLCKKLQIGWHGEDVDNRLLIPKTLSLSQDIIKGIAIYMKEQKNEIERAWDEVLST
jgi:putative nucleotidyltransferase with HDIG domain